MNLFLVNPNNAMFGLVEPISLGEKALKRRLIDNDVSNRP